MAAQRVGRRVNRPCAPQSPGQNQQRRRARVTVKYNRKELQRRLEVEKWVDCGLDELYRGRVSSYRERDTVHSHLLPGNLSSTSYVD